MTSPNGARPSFERVVVHRSDPATVDDLRQLAELGLLADLTPELHGLPAADDATYAYGLAEPGLIALSALLGVVVEGTVPDDEDDPLGATWETSARFTLHRAAYAAHAALLAWLAAARVAPALTSAPRRRRPGRAAEAGS